MSGIRRFGQVIRVRAEHVVEYERIHADPRPEVNAAIRRANLRNYSIYRHGDLLFAYVEYVGEDFAADMARMAEDPAVNAWWKITDPMQEPFPDREPGSWWLDLREVYHLD